MHRMDVQHRQPVIINTSFLKLVNYKMDQWHMLEILPFSSIIQQHQFTLPISLCFQKWDVMITCHSIGLFKDLWFNLVTSPMEMELAVMLRLGKAIAMDNSQQTKVHAPLHLGRFPMKSAI